MNNSNLSNENKKGVNIMENKTKVVNGRKKGFTLIELIAVIAVIAILALAIVPNIIKYRDKAVVSSGVSDAKTLLNAYKTYCADENKDPVAGITLADMITATSNEITSDEVTSLNKVFVTGGTFNIENLTRLANLEATYSNNKVTVSSGKITSILP